MHSIETRESWCIACAALAVLSVSYGAPQVVVVALKPIADSLGDARSLPALAYSCAWLGTGVGGLFMGRIAGQIGVRWTVSFGALMVATGLIISSGGAVWQLILGHGVFIGLLGNGGLNAPLYVYVSRWFDRRRGTALALVSSGQYVAGMVWPWLFARAIGAFGWQHTMHTFAVFVALSVAPIGFIVLRDPPEPLAATGGSTGPRAGQPVLGLRPNLALLMLGLAGFCCCVPMAMPLGHLVAFCSDLGIRATQGAAMLSVLLGSAFLSRQFWGWLADRIGGLRTICAASAAQLTAMSGFLLTQNELGLFVVSGVFGLGFSGLIPAYVLTVRELFPAAEANWRVPCVLLFSAAGMAAGGWLAGWIFDRTGYYAVAFGAGMAFNVVNLLIIGLLLMQFRQVRRLGLAAVAE